MLSLGCVDAADLAEGALTGRQLPFRVDRETDVGQLEEFGVDLGLVECGVPTRLEVEHDVHARGARRLDVRSQLLDVGLAGVVAVRPRDALRGRGDDLEGRDDGHVTERVVVRGDLLRALDARGDALRAEHAELRGVRVSVERDQSAAGEEHLAAAGQLNAGDRDRHAVGESVGGAEVRAGGEDLVGRRRRQRADRAAVRPWVVALDGDRTGARGLRGGGRGDRTGQRGRRRRPHRPGRSGRSEPEGLEVFGRSPAFSTTLTSGAAVRRSAAISGVIARTARGLSRSNSRTSGRSAGSVTEGFEVGPAEGSEVASGPGEAVSSGSAVESAVGSLVADELPEAVLDGAAERFLGLDSVVADGVAEDVAVALAVGVGRCGRDRERRRRAGQGRRGGCQGRGGARPRGLGGLSRLGRLGRFGGRLGRRPRRPRTMSPPGWPRR